MGALATALLSSVGPALIQALPSLIPQLAPAIGALVPKLLPASTPAQAAAVTTIAANFHPNVVQWFQQALNALAGAGLTVDGQWGPSTQAAVAKAVDALGIVPGSEFDKLVQAAITAAVQAV